MALDADAKRVSRADQAVRSATNLSNTLSEEEDETDTSSTSDSESDSDIQSEKEEAVAPVKSTTTTPVLPDSRKSYSRAPSPRLTPKSSSSTAPPPASGDRQRRHSHRQTQFHHNHNHHQRRPRHVSFPTTTHPSSPRRPTLSSRANSDPTGSPPHLHPIPIGRLIRDIIPDRIARSLPVATGHAESHRSPALASDVVSDSGYGEAPAKDTSSGTRIPTRTPASPPSIEAAPPTPPTRLLVVSSSSPSAAAYADASGNIRAAAASDLAPRLVIVNPTPHPTPPATPEVAEPPQVTGFGSQSNAPPHSHRSLSTTSNSSGSLSPPPITMIISKTSPLRNPSSALGVQQKPLSVKPPLARSFSSSSSTSESVDSRRGGQEGIFFLHKSTSSLSPVREITQLPLPPDAMLTNIAQLENKRDGKSRIKEKEGDHDAIPKSEVAVPVSAIATTSAAPTTELHNIAEGNEHTSVASSHARSVGSNKSRGGKLAKEKEKEPGKGKAKEVIKTSGAKSKLGMRQTKGLTGLTMTAAHPAGHAGKHAPSGVRVEKKVRMNSSSRERGPSAERRTSHGANGKGKGKETAHVKVSFLCYPARQPCAYADLLPDTACLVTIANRSFTPASNHTNRCQAYRSTAFTQRQGQEGSVSGLYFIRVLFG
ncbi:hypothetical protein SISSUDRAFT_670430 [Sistotremastrum suecicum HHB10207 ss-3]|uniref:Uncharacterized protein n=1 Tax=Sistotremastrum suecicum HHB10207 ss-3 TaxID=1314776 RepID=A0A166E192_9AGAM|nr:hypothetical protein SISSUDRAFT_670430 [Sistotremastrum suecicum HHB10207 ss-3]